MADFLLLSTYPVPIDTEGASELEPIRMGSSSRSSEGTLRTSYRNIKRKWRMTTRPLTQEEKTIVLTYAGVGDFIPVSGTAFGDEVITCEVRVSDRNYIADGLSSKVVLQLDIEEV